MIDRLKFISKSIGLVFLFYFLLRITFFVFQFDKFASSSFLSILKAFFVGTLFDTVAIFYSNILFIFILSLPFNWVLNRWVQLGTKIWYVIINTVAIALNLIDVVYFDYSQRRTGDEILITGNNTNDLIYNYLHDFWHIILIFLGLLILLIFLISKIERPTVLLGSTARNRVHSGLTFLCITGISILGLRGGLFRTPLFTQDAAKFVDARLVALATNTPHQIISTFQAENLKKPEYIDAKIAEETFNPYLQYASKGLEKKNVVILILESFDKEYIGYYNNGKGYTPFLDSLITKSISFQHSYANGTTSIECPPALFSSIPSLMNDSYINSQYNVNRLSGLGELLSKEGYSTGFYHGGENGTMNFDAFIGVTNFGGYYGLMQYPNPKESDGHWGIPDEPYLQYFAKQLDESPKPFCKAVFTLSSHHPYLVPKQYEKTLPEGTLPIHKAVAYSDLALRKFFATVKNCDWYKNTLFVITADHTSITDNNQYLNYYGDYSVPILFFEEGGQPQVIDNQVVQHKDVMPTILYKLGYSKRFFSLGQNMFSKDRKTFSITYRNGNYHYFTWPYMLTYNTVYSTQVQSLSPNNPVSTRLTDSLDRAFKSYLQIYESRILNNELY